MRIDERIGRTVGFLAALSACTGSIAGGGGSGQPGGGGRQEGGGTAVGGSATTGGGGAGSVEARTTAAVIRRLDKVEYNNTIRDLLGDDSAPADAFTAEESALGFSNNAAALTVPPLLAEQYLGAAEAVSARAMAKLATLLPCSSTGDDACALTFVRDFGARAWRGPIAKDDEDRLMMVFRAAKAQPGGSFKTGIDLVLRTMLVSAPFLYRVELGVDAGGGRKRPTSWEMASRLSYFLWGSMPDAALFDAAKKDALVTPAQITAQAERMLADPKALDVIHDFHRQWLRYGALSPQVVKDATRFPSFSSTTVGGMKRELDLVVETLFQGAGAKFGDVFLTSRTFVDGALATFYGLPAPAGDGFAAASFPDRRPGVLTRGAWLTLLAHNDQTSPTLRGKFVLERVLCGAVPPPPPNVNNTPVKVEPGSSTRERMAAHATNPSCSGCHAKMDPIGFAFEGYDAVGRPRTEDGGKPVDVKGAIPSGDAAGSIDGPDALMQKLAASADVRSCVARHWFRYALGRGEADADEPTVQKLAGVLGGDADVWRKLLVALTQTDAFLTLAPQEGP